jgi:drug/metabolite transporter (DMT)-like permease
MLSVALAGLSGLVWGVGDFAGGKAAQQAAALPVAWVSKLVSLPLLAVYLAATYVTPIPASLRWGALAGVFGMAGLMLFYRALSGGAMTVVAPVTAVTSAAIPVVVGLASGERPPAIRLAGVGCALLAIALVSLARPRPGERVVVTPALVGWAVLSGTGFALFFVFTARAGDAAGGEAGGEAGLWPVAASQLSGILLGGVLLLVLRPDGWPQRRSLSWAALAGPMDMTANTLYLAASRAGDLSVVAPLASLYPVTTVLLALLVDRERVRSVQVVGLVLAVAALLLVAR